MPGTSDKSAVLDSYAGGMEGVAIASTRVKAWRAPTPCGAWTVLELAGHLLAIVRYYHRLLDAAAAGAPLTELPRGPDLAVMNARDLAALSEADGPTRAARFVELAGEHLGRLSESDWDMRLGNWSGLGDLSVAEHTGVAIGEWHVHAWDLARANGGDHRPSDPEVLAAGQHVLGRLVGPGDPWTQLLVAYGRDPEWSIPTDR
ncbi:MAG: maleylpyruvate isomerase N-terminal domain-containing protein [Acidimicrobiales bacterium]